VFKLVAKELRLQQLSFATVAASMVLWAVSLGSVRDPAAVFNVLALIFVLLLTILIGALASAEERQLGTLDGQLLLPVAAWRQWVVKLAVIFGLALASAAAVPLVSGVYGGDLGDAWVPLSFAVVSLTAGSLYVSSLCRNTMTAVVISLVALPITAAAFIEVAEEAVAFFMSVRAQQQFPGWVTSFRRLEETVAAAFLVTLVVLLTRLAYVNHRTSEWSGRRVLQQILIVVVFLAVWNAMISALPLIL
jgi:hypothetical protein